MFSTNHAAYKYDIPIKQNDGTNQNGISKKYRRTELENTNLKVDKPDQC